MISLVVAFYKDYYLIEETIRRAVADIHPDELEVIIVDDGSFDPLKESLFPYPNVRVLRNKANRGVGFAFDRGVSEAIGDTIVLMGSDVYLKKGKWFRHAKKAAEINPNGFTASCCVGAHVSSKGRLYKWGSKRYGADLLFKVGMDDLPENSPKRQLEDYRDILQARWLDVDNPTEPFEVPCILGACYVTTKKFYRHIGGWGWMKSTKGLTVEESLFSGHKIWGGLEPMISLKTWLMGGKCMVYPKWETGHVFGRDAHVNASRGSRYDMMYFNKLFIAYTLLDNNVARALDKHLLPGLNENKARWLIKKRQRAVIRERDYVNERRVHDLSWFMDKFGYKLDI